MSERSTERGRASGRERSRRGTTGPVGTMFGAAFGPVAAAVGSVVDANRVAFAYSIGTGVPWSNDDDGLEDAATIEIADTDDDGATAEDVERGDSGTDSEPSD